VFCHLLSLPEGVLDEIFLAQARMELVLGFALKTSESPRRLLTTALLQYLMLILGLQGDVPGLFTSAAQ